MQNNDHGEGGLPGEPGNPLGENLNEQDERKKRRMWGYLASFIGISVLLVGIRILINNQPLPPVQGPIQGPKKPGGPENDLWELPNLSSLVPNDFWAPISPALGILLYNKIFIIPFLVYSFNIYSIIPFLCLIPLFINPISISFILPSIWLLPLIFKYKQYNF